MLSGFTALTPVDCTLTTSGKISSISCAITPNWIPFLFITESADSSVISSLVLYSKFLTFILLIFSKPILLSTIFFLILLSDVVVQAALFSAL